MFDVWFHVCFSCTFGSTVANACVAMQVGVQQANTPKPTTPAHHSNKPSLHITRPRYLSHFVSMPFPKISIHHRLCQTLTISLVPSPSRSLSLTDKPSISLNRYLDFSHVLHQYRPPYEPRSTSDTSFLLRLSLHVCQLPARSTHTLSKRMSLDCSFFQRNHTFPSDLVHAHLDCSST